MGATGDAEGDGSSGGALDPGGVVKVELEESVVEGVEAAVTGTGTV